MSLYANAVSAERAAKISRDMADHEAGITALREENKRLRTIEAAARNLCTVKGRHHSEIAMRALMDACGIKTPNDEAHRKDAAGGLSGGADCSAA